MCCQTTCNSKLAALEIQLAEVLTASEHAHLFRVVNKEYLSWLVNRKIHLIKQISGAKKC